MLARRRLVPSCMTCLVLGFVLACREAPTAPAATAMSERVERSEGTPRFLRAEREVPPGTRRVSFWAVRGRRTSAALRVPAGRDRMADLLRFTVPPRALAALPDGRRIAEGDSVRITITLLDPRRLIVEFQPSGLSFSPRHPARLRMHYDGASADLDGDGRVDARDAALAESLSIWKREAPTDPWQRIASVRDGAHRTIDADIEGFTDYAIAY
jgi:hypothetical protein